MADDGFDKEVEAIRDVLKALAPLTPVARESVLKYVTSRLGGSRGTPNAAGTPPGDAAPALPGAPAVPASVSNAPDEVVHIKAFKEKKAPRSANEMAALVAYYLAEIVPKEQRRTTIKPSDIETQFKIAEFRLPGRLSMTLPNAKAAGYFDAVGDGGYRLNPVGHNLVAHAMQRAATEARQSTPRKRRAPGKKPAKKPPGRKQG